MEAIATYSALVYDDDPRRRAVTCEALERVGFSCRGSGRTAEAKKLMHGVDHDLAVVDVRAAERRQLAVLAAAVARAPGAKTVAITNAGNPDLMRKLFAYGVDEVAIAPIDMSGFAMKALSLFEIDRWRAELSTPLGAESPQDLLRRIEKTLLSRSDELGGCYDAVFDQEGDAGEPPLGIYEFIESYNSPRSASGSLWLRTTGEQREFARVTTRTSTENVPVTKHGECAGEGFRAILCDISEAGALMIHTRAVPLTNLAMRWYCVTKNLRVTVPAHVVRCESIGRFYEVGVRFD
ncbi:PilZ domain-containing protein [Pseudobythopirellula maris]|nr:PilZ domain-containing protein [Pseudobythopirellula maris]